ncbi:MAG: flagellar export chaperone FlgN [bacterium]
MESALRAEGEKYEQLYHLSQDQIHLLQQDEADIDSVAELMSQKMDIVEELKALEPQHQNIKDLWKERFDHYAPEQREVIARLRDEGIVRIEKLAEFEAEIARLIKRHETGISHKLKSIQQGKSVSRAYMKMQSIPPRFIDKKK